MVDRFIVLKYEGKLHARRKVKQYKEGSNLICSESSKEIQKYSH
jgi:hypothetical protein